MLASRESMGRLSEYLTKVVPEVGTVELFACGYGDQESKPLHVGTIRPEDIGGDAFWFEEKQFLTVTRSGD